MPRDTFALSSTALLSGSYDDETQELELVFTNGRSYTYQSVPPEVVTELKNAPSAGNYFRTNIKDQYGA